MGMGLLAAGALSGLGQAGMNIGQQMIKSGLDEQEREYLMSRQKAFNLEQAREMQALKDEVIDKERKATGMLYEQATSGTGVAEGPPTEDGVLPKGPMSDKEKRVAYSDALGKAGRHAEKMQVDTLLQRDEATTAMQDLRDRLNQRTNDTKLATTGMRVNGQLAGKSADLAARLAKLRGGSTGTRSNSSGKSGDGHDKFYDDFFKADEKAGLNFQDTDGYALFKDVIRQAKIGNRDPDILAAEAVRRISEAREAATVNGVLDRAKYRELLDKIRQPKNPTLQDDPSISDASIIEAGRRAAESEVGGDKEIEEPWWKGKATADDFLQ